MEDDDISDGDERIKGKSASYSGNLDVSGEGREKANEEGGDEDGKEDEKEVNK